MTLCKKKNNNANTFSTIYEFNTSSEFRGFMYILNYFDASNTCTSFQNENSVSYHACFISLCHEFIFTILIVYIFILLYHYDFILLVKNEK